MQDLMQDITVRDLEIGDAGWLIERHARHYHETEGFDASFEALVAEVLAAFIRQRDPACERAFIAEREGRRLGSIFCVKEGTPGIAKLRLFLVEPEMRGTGLGRHLLERCLRYAAGAGYTRMRLWTHESHRAAGALYARTGFRLVETRPLTSFGQSLVEQSWEIDLPPLAKPEPGG